MARAVFLDRDGVLIRTVLRDGKPHPVASSAALELLPGVAEALCRLHAAGFLLIVVTNQPDVARGTQLRENVEAMHSRLTQELPLDEILTCYHDGDGCDCRKPKPGALLDAARRLGIDLGRSFMVGDRWRDVEAGQRAGCTCLFIDYGYQERQPTGQHTRVVSLPAAADWILAAEPGNSDASGRPFPATGSQSASS
jgi:D-glycero-D-manno-heptose 1,7-bisphosphate phosphatase